MMNKPTRMIAPEPVHQNSMALRFGKPLRTVRPIELGASSNDSYAINPVGTLQAPLTAQQRVAEIVKSLKQKS